MREFAIDVAKRLLFIPYIWGGNDPISGFDCSGFVIEVLKSVGILPRKGDWTAHGLSEKWNSATEIKEGCLLFWDWNKDGKIDHVEIVVKVLSENHILTIGASDGGSKNTSLAQAIKDDSYIKIRPARLGWIETADPFQVDNT